MRLIKAIGMGFLWAIIITIIGTVTTAGLFGVLAPLGFIPCWCICSYVYYQNEEKEKN